MQSERPGFSRIADFLQQQNVSSHNNDNGGGRATKTSLQNTTDLLSLVFRHAFILDVTKCGWKNRLRSNIYLTQRLNDTKGENETEFNLN